MIFTDLFENTDQPSRVKFQGTDHDIGEERYVFSINGNPEVFTFSSDEDRPDPDSPSFEEILARVQRDGAMEHYRITPAEQQAIAKKIAAERQRYLDQRRPGVSEGIDIGQEWMTDTELDQYVPDDLQQEWRELVGYDEAGNAHPLWANMTGDYEPDVSDPEHRAWMVKVANKWFAMKRIPNVRFFAVRDRDDELEWLVQIGDQGVAEGHADQQRKIIKKGGRPVGEVGIDRESSPGAGMYYMKHYASGLDLGGYDSREEAMDELRYAVKQGVSEAMKPSDIPPGMRKRLSMRDIEAERPRGAFRFRVTFPDGSHTDFMDFDAARASARIEQGQIRRLNETQPTAAKTARRGSARIDRILHMLRARHPQAQNDLEALILDFRGQQAQDRSDISRLDAENDAEEADIERLEQLLQQLKQRRGTAPVAEAAPNEATRFYQQQYQQEMQRHGSARLAKELANRATAQRFGANWNIVITQPGQPDRYATPADAEMLDRGRRELRDLMTKEAVAEGLRDGEHHIATVTLDDGSKKKVRITSDEGFRDQIERHFAKQGHTVTDIDVDYAVRSDLDEAKKKPQPTNPELWSRAKSAARSKFDVYPSAYANAWAAKYYKSKGGGWRMGKPKKD